MTYLVAMIYRSYQMEVQRVCAVNTDAILFMQYIELAVHMSAVWIPITTPTLGNSDDFYIINVNTFSVSTCTSHSHTMVSAYMLSCVCTQM
jgi:hypothetical protein